MSNGQNAIMLDEAPLISPSGTTYIQQGAGQAIVFVHGVGMNHQVWSPQLSYFSDSYAAISYDLLGHGGSDLPPRPTRLSDLSLQLLELLDDLKINSAYVVGHSMGSLVALDFALTYPHRVKRLVALNAVYQRSTEQRQAAVSRADKIDAGDLSGLTEATIKRWVDPHRSTPNRDDVERLRTWLRSINRVGYARVYRLFATADACFSGRMGELRAPVLFATGQLDPHSTPEMTHKLAHDVSDGSALVVPGERHMMAFFSPMAVNPHIIRFLSQGTGRFVCEE